MGIEPSETEQAMAVTRDRPAPYAPASAILDIVGRYRNRGLPFPVTAEVLARVGIAQSLVPRTLYALQALDLINDIGNPTETLEGIRLAPEAEHKKRLEDWLKGTYADVFSFVDPTTDDETRIRDAFRSYQPVGQQDRMVTLFQGLCTGAGIMPEKAAPTSRIRTHSASSRTAPTSRRSAPTKSPPPKQTPSASLPPALTGLLGSLPDADSGWSRASRNKFVKTFEVVLDFCIPIREGAGQETEDNGGQHYRRFQELPSLVSRD
jgi:hypothetical protein